LTGSALAPSARRKVSIVVWQSR